MVKGDRAPTVGAREATGRGGCRGPNPGVLIAVLTAVFVAVLAVPQLAIQNHPRD